MRFHKKLGMVRVNMNARLILLHSILILLLYLPILVIGWDLAGPSPYMELLTK